MYVYVPIFAQMKKRKEIEQRFFFLNKMIPCNPYMYRLSTAESLFLTYFFFSPNCLNQTENYIF